MTTIEEISTGSSKACPRTDDNGAADQIPVAREISGSIWATGQQTEREKS